MNDADFLKEFNFLSIEDQQMFAEIYREKAVNELNDEDKISIMKQHYEEGIIHQHAAP